MRVDLNEIKELYDTWNSAQDTYLIDPDIIKLMNAFPVMLAELDAAREVIIAALACKEKARTEIIKLDVLFAGMLNGFFSPVYEEIRKYHEVINAKG